MAGGPSSEREISLKSGKAVFDALIKRGEDVIFIDVKDKNSFLEKLESISIDCVFIALHGRFGEDGAVQHLLEELHIPYTGSGETASKLALDKIASREIFQDNKLNVPRYKIINRGEKQPSLDFNLPYVVKPQYEGSSIGLTVVKDGHDLPAAINKAFEYGEKIIIEEYISGRELTVAILGEEALPVIEIITKENVYDFSAKYNDESTRYIVPCKLPDEIYNLVQDMAVRVHNLLGLRDISRIDMRMDREGRIYVLEANSIPGLTQRSLLPKAALAAGMAFDELCMRIVELAYRRGLKIWQKSY